ncbi:S-adenosyl-L-methionine-dependent methyltransferase [Stipitochalara longipes BDJ]|nr:S-adenosyl-L-methionine-dependent methyltransferase [Stipitochalara longipes BDJ]
MHQPDSSSEIEARPAAGENDDGYESDQESTTTSIATILKQHTFERGLRYHAFQDGKYPFPNDENEQNRDDMKHAMIMELCEQKLYYAPIGEGVQTILDLGTGTGIWLIEMADKFPSATCQGVDLSPIQPSWVPPNVQFVVDDIELPWTHKPDYFDYIHVRHTLPFVKDRPRLFAQAFEHLKPGAWIEFQEFEFSPNSDDNSIISTPELPYFYLDFMRFHKQAMTALGGDVTGVTKLQTELAAAGFSQIKEEVFKCPLGIWPKNKRLRLVGLYLRESILDGLAGMAGRPFSAGLGWGKEEIEVFLAKVRTSLKDSSRHTYLPFRVIYAQKPEKKDKDESPR